MKNLVPDYLTLPSPSEEDGKMKYKTIVATCDGYFSQLCNESYTVNGDLVCSFSEKRIHEITALPSEIIHSAMSLSTLNIINLTCSLS